MRMVTTVTRGDIFWVDFPQRDGSVQGSTRPAIVTSNDMNNKYCTTVNVIPLTSQLDKADYPMHIMIGTDCGLEKASVALCEQETTISKKRLLTHIGHCTEETFKRVGKGIMVQRGISDPFNITKVRRLIIAIEELIKDESFDVINELLKKTNFRLLTSIQKGLINIIKIIDNSYDWNLAKIDGNESEWLNDESVIFKTETYTLVFSKNNLQDGQKYINNKWQ